MGEAKTGGLDDRSPGGPSHGILRKLGYLLSAHTAREGMQALFVILLARHSAIIYGEFVLAASMGQVLRFVGEFGFNPQLVTLLVREGSDPGDVLAQVSILKGALLFLGCVAMVLFVHWQRYSPDLQALVFALGIPVGAEALASSFFTACEVQGRQDLEGKIKTLGAAAGFGYGYCSLFLGAAPFILAFYKAVETASNLAGVLFFTAKRFCIRPRRVRLAHIWATGRGSVVFTLMGIAAIVYNKANVFFLQRFGGPAQVAQYGVTWDLVDGVSILASNLLLARILFPLFMELWEKDRKALEDLVRNSTRWLLAVAFPIMFTLFIESDRIIGLIYGHAYGDAAWMQKWLVVTIAIGFMHNISAYLMISMKQHIRLLCFYLGGLVFNLVCCAVLIPGNPLLGTVLAIVLTKAAVAAATVANCQIRLGLITGKALLHLAAAVGLGAGLYLLGKEVMFREAAEILALVPILTLAYRWRLEPGRERGTAALMPEG